MKILFFGVFIILLGCKDQDAMSQNKGHFKSSFTPAQYSSQAWWFRGDAAIASSGNINGLTNKFGNATYDAVKVSDGTRPTLVTGQNNTSAVRFVGGSNQILQATNFPTLGDFTMRLVFQASSTSGTQTLIQSEDATTHGYKIRIVSGVITVVIQNGDNVNVATPTTSSFSFTDTSTPHVLTMKYYRQRIAEVPYGSDLYGNVSVMVIKLDNVTKISVMNHRQMSYSTAVTKIGSDTGNNSFSGDIYDALCLNKFMTELEEANDYRYINAYYGLNIPVTMPLYYIESDPISCNITYPGLYASDPNTLGKLKFKGCLPNSDSPLIPIAMLPGFGESHTSWTTAVMRRYSKNNIGNFAAFAISPRGGSQSSGSRDAGGLEPYDCIGPIDFMQRALPGFINTSIAGASGISAGGGDVLGAATKHPDFFSFMIAHFCMSDWGSDPTYGWYQENSTFRVGLETMVGGNPTDKPNEYRSRKHLESVAINYQGILALAGSPADAIVAADQRSRVKDAYDAILKTIYYYSDAAYVHAYPTDDGASGIALLEPTWMALLTNSSPVTFPSTGTNQTFNGYVINKKFSIWATIDTDANAGTNSTFRVTFDWASNSYSVDPLGITMKITILVNSGAHAGKIISQTISTPTALTPL